MNIKFFIDRPVLSGVISILIIILGVVGLYSLPVEQFPDIAPPTIQVSASYTGASASSVQKSVIEPLEESINGVENMLYMTSSSTNSGTGSITIYFKQGTDADMAAVNVQNRVSAAAGLLPAEVTKMGVTTSKRQASMLQVFSLISEDDKYDELFLSNYVNINIKPSLQRVQGVGEVEVMGPSYSMRIWLKPDQMKQYHLIPSDVTGALAEQNLETPTGSLGENSGHTFQYAMNYTGRLTTIDEFEKIVLKALPDGSVLYLGDVATIELARTDYSISGSASGHHGVSARIFQLSGSNSTQVNEEVERLLTKIQKDLPEGMKLVTIMSTNNFLYASIQSVLETLLIAILLVIFVVYFFLQDLRSTLIPIVAIVVSLIGTFFFISLMGFSLNLLTLFALILVIGTVVDDAIVVVEAVQARFDEGYTSAYKASIDAMKTLVSPIITTTLVFMAVFIPVSFMSGTSGTFYRQFGLTMAVAVAISLVNALTLSPVLCSLLLKPRQAKKKGDKKTIADRMRSTYDATYKIVLEKYKKNILFMVHHKYITWSLLALVMVALVMVMKSTKTGFIPDEDQGTVFVNVITAPGSSLYTTNLTMDKVESILKTMPEIKTYNRVSGLSMIAGQGTNYGMFILSLTDWSQRTEDNQSAQGVINTIYAKTANLKESSIFAMAPGLIQGYGMGNSVELHILDKQGHTLSEFNEATQAYLSELNKRPEIIKAFSSFNINYPQYQVEVDAAQCKRAGLSPKTVLEVLGGYYGGIYASNFNRFNKVYRVMIQADPKDRLDVNSLDQIFVRNGEEMAPISQFVSIKRVYGAEVLNRFNLYPSIQVNVQPATGYTTNDAMTAISAVANTALKQGYGYDYGGISREESSSADTTVLIFVICLVFIYLIMAALYESFFIPLAVLLAVPFGLFGSFLFAKFMGIENNIYLQTGLVMLIGLISKTAILLTEYATERRKAGMTLSQAAYSAAAARLRPILMTALTMVFGMLPLMLATGVGANGNRSLGTGLVGGMLIGTFAMLFVVPVFFIVFQSLQEYFVPLKNTTVTDPRILEEIEEINAQYKTLEANNAINKK